MRYQTFSDQDQATYPVAILVPQLDQSAMMREYIDPTHLLPENVIGYELFKTGKKTSATDMRTYLDELTEILEDLETQYIFVGDSDYFKVLTGKSKADPYSGYVLPNTYPESMAGRFHVLYLPNWRQVFYNPGPTKAKIQQAFDAFWHHGMGIYRDPGCTIIQYAAYPSGTTDIAAWLQQLLDKPSLTCDIEAFSLKHFSAGIGTITFCWSDSEGISFPVDLSGDPPAIRRLLARFFREYRGNLKFHNAGYDVGVLIFQLYMKDLLDTEGLLDGLDVFFNRSWDDTKLIAYLATNSCAGNQLGLKVQAQEFAGNYAVDEIKDIRAIPLPKLLEYNLVDGLSTWFVYNKHYATMVADNQLSVYEDLFKPALVDIIQMQLTGMPVDMEKVVEAKEILGIVRADAIRRIQGKKIVQDFTSQMNEEAEEARYQDWLDRKNNGVKVRAYTPGNFQEEFNPNSPPQKQRLLYEILDLPVIERTDTKQPATGGDVLQKLKAYTTDQDALDLIDALLDFANVDKIYGTFIPALEGAVLAPDGCYYLFGNFNLGGTISGRLSSSDPNLQNLPANVAMLLSEYLLSLLGDRLAPYLIKGKLSLGKLIKDCFRAPSGWLFGGLDFASLEDRISALTTRDPNKLKVYTDGFDGHSLRAQSYFAEDMPNIELSPEGARCFRARIGDKEVLFHEHEQITYLGKSMTGAELWDRLQNVRSAA